MPKISALPDASTSYTGTELGVIVQNGTTYRFTIPSIVLDGKLSNGMPTSGFSANPGVLYLDADKKLREIVPTSGFQVLCNTEEDLYNFGFRSLTPDYLNASNPVGSFLNLAKYTAGSSHFVTFASDYSASFRTASQFRGDIGAQVASGVLDGLITLNATAFGSTAGTFCQGNDPRLSDSRPPSGSAGGSLDGTYPNPTIKASGVSASSYGSASEVATFTVNSEGRVTTASNKTISITASQVNNATTVGQNFVTLSNPSATTFPRINADNTLSTRTPAQTRDDLGFVSITTLGTSGTVDIDVASNTAFILSLTGNVTLTLSNEADGRRFTLYVRGQASGYTITWWSGIKWTSGSAPTIPTVSGRVMPIVFIRLASGEWLGTPAGENY